MAKYRIKSAEVEAWQFTGLNATEIHKALGRLKRLPDGNIGIFSKDDYGGYRAVHKGDWIVRDAAGYLRVFKPAVFAAAYECAE